MIKKGPADSSDLKLIHGSFKHAHVRTSSFKSLLQEVRKQRNLSSFAFFKLLNGGNYPSVSKKLIFITKENWAFNEAIRIELSDKTVY